MDSKADDDLAATLRAIEEAYAARLPERFAAMQADVDRCRIDTADRAAWESLQRHVHALSGSAGTFGFAELGMRSTELDITLSQFLAQGAPVEQVPTLLDGVQSMLAWAAAASSGASAVESPVPPQRT